MDLSAPERPDAGDRAEQRALAGARRSGDQDHVAARDRHAHAAEERLAVRERQVDALEGEPRVGAGRDPNPADLAPDAVDRVAEADEPIDDRAPLGDVGVRVDDEAQRLLDLAEGQRRLHEPAERDLAAEEARGGDDEREDDRSEEHTSELQSLAYLVCRLLLEK